jgi:alkylation response protein AidB-like acyl-CoA dehydrogenase
MRSNATSSPNASSASRGAEDMDFSFSEEQAEMRATVRAVLERTCQPGDVRAAAAGDPRSATRWSQLADLGVLGTMVAESLGGLGLSAVDLVGVAEEAGWAALPEPLSETAGVIAPFLARVASGGGDGAQHAARWLPEILAGNVACALGGIEISAGGAISTTRPRATADPANPVLESPRVQGAQRATLFVLAESEAGPIEYRLLERENVTVEVAPTLDGSRDVGHVAWSTRGTFLACDDTAPGLTNDVCNAGALFSAAQLLGLAYRMITMAADYAKERQQFGRPIGSFQAVKHHLANARVKLEFARPATYRAADSLARALPSRAHDAAMAKALASDAAEVAARVALQVHGAIGYTEECDLQLFMKRAWALAAAWGDARSQRARVLTLAMAERA